MYRPELAEPHENLWRGLAKSLRRGGVSSTNIEVEAVQLSGPACARLSE